MYEIHAAAVYVTERAEADPLCAARMDRMMPHVHAGHVEVVGDARLNDIVAQHGWHRPAGRRTGELRRGRSLSVIFNRFEWLDSETWWRRKERFPALGAFLLDGSGAWGFRRADDFARTMDSVCQSAWEIHAAYGCLHSCAYCHVGDFVNIMLNLEELADRVEDLVRQTPQQQLYKFDNQTDTICFEPEYGASALMVERFARLADDPTAPEAYLMLYTKSDNVGHLLDLDHRGRTVINWSLSGLTQSALIERDVPPTGARLAAAWQCRKAGYPVRIRLSPIVPVVDWRAEARTLIRRIYEHIEPDIITLDVVGWMSPKAMRASMDLSLLDPRFRAEVDALIETGQEPKGKHLFSHALRAEVLGFVIDEIRRVRPTATVAICNETRAMWQELGARLGQTPPVYRCCCGPNSVPYLT